MRPVNVFDPWFGVDFASPFLEALGDNITSTQRICLRRMLIDVVEVCIRFAFASIKQI
jgi:hypothetical protein